MGPKEDKYFMSMAEWERFYKNLNKVITVSLKSIKELGDAFGRVAKILKDDKFYEAICKADKYIEEQERLRR